MADVLLEEVAMFDTDLALIIVSRGSSTCPYRTVWTYSAFSVGIGVMPGISVPTLRGDLSVTSPSLADHVPEAAQGGGLARETACRPYDGNRLLPVSLAHFSAVYTLANGKERQHQSCSDYME